VLSIERFEKQRHAHRNPIEACNYLRAEAVASA
jgi:hypothetical protein